MRKSPAEVWGALGNRLNRRHPGRTTTDVDAAAASIRVATSTGTRSTASPSRATRIRNLLRPARVTPYLLRRGWLWY